MHPENTALSYALCDQLIPARHPISENLYATKCCFTWQVEVTARIGRAPSSRARPASTQLNLSHPVSSNYQCCLTCSALNSLVLRIGTTAVLFVFSFFPSLPHTTAKNIFTGWERGSLLRASAEHLPSVRGLRAHSFACPSLCSLNYQMPLHLLRT